MDLPGVEPGSSPRQGDVVPLDHGPFVLCLRICSMDRRGVEPRFPVCKAGVVPLDQQPAIENEREVARMFKRRSARESNSVLLLTTEVCCRNTCRPAFCESSRQDSNLRYPVCKTGVLAARRRDELRTVARVGFEPTGTRFSTWSRCQLAYRAVL